MRVDIGGAQLFFDVDGAELVTAGAWMHQRHTVVLLPDRPGEGGHAIFKGTIGPALVQVAQVVYLEYRSGAGAGASHAEDVEACADVVARFCETLEIDRPVLLGSGFGALVAARLADRRPELVRALGLVATGDEPALASLRAEAGRLACPSLVRLAGDGAEEELGEAASGFVAGLGR